MFNIFQFRGREGEQRYFSSFAAWLAVPTTVLARKSQELRRHWNVNHQTHFIITLAYFCSSTAFFHTISLQMHPESFYSWYILLEFCHPMAIIFMICSRDPISLILMYPWIFVHWVLAIFTLLRFFWDSLQNQLSQLCVLYFSSPIKPNICCL